MQSSEIYSDFSEEIHWIRERVLEDTDAVPKPLRKILEYYLKERLIISPDEARVVEYDPELGRPVPYATFWFSKALGLEDEAVMIDLALGLVYSSIATTIRDDIFDQKNTQVYHHFALTSWYLQRYLTVFGKLFSRESCFWYHLAECVKEKARYESWSLSPIEYSGVSPFSESFLKESSRYFWAVVLPTIAAIAYYTNKEEKIPVVWRFLRNFSMGWRIYDDLCDWRKDLQNKNLNHSSVLIYAKQRCDPDSHIDDAFMQSLFLDSHFIEDAYDAILRFYSDARRDVSSFNSPYLTKFMDEQISFHKCRRDLLLNSGSELYRKIQRILE